MTNVHLLQTMGFFGVVLTLEVDGGIVLNLVQVIW